MLSILYYIFTVIHTTVWCIISALVLAVTYPFDRSRRLVHECSRYMTWVFFGLPPRVRRTIDGVENIDRRIEDKELSGYVSERGLGTPATRAAIIEKILADGYAERKNKVISATEMGIKMINFVPSEVKSVEMTAAMELQLATIENGTASADEVISSITEKIKAIIEAEKHRAHTPVAEPRTVQRIPVGKCPKCGGNVYKFVRDNTGIFYCEKAPKDCIFRVYEDDYFFTSKGKKLTEPMMKNLLSHGEVKVSGFKSEKTGNTYNAVVSFADRTDKNGNAKIGFTMRFEDKTKR